MAVSPATFCPGLPLHFNGRRRSKSAEDAAVTAQCEAAVVLPAVILERTGEMLETATARLLDLFRTEASGSNRLSRWFTPTSFCSSRGCSSTMVKVCVVVEKKSFPKSEPPAAELTVSFHLQVSPK